MQYHCRVVYDRKQRSLWSDADSLVNIIKVSPDKMSYVVTNVICYCILQHESLTSLCCPAQFALPCSYKQKSLQLARCHTCSFIKCFLCGDITLCTRGIRIAENLKKQMKILIKCFLTCLKCNFSLRFNVPLNSYVTMLKCSLFLVFH